MNTRLPVARVGFHDEIIIDKSKDKMLGYGRLGKVFPGIYNDAHVAVKRMDSMYVELFLKEIEILSESTYEHVVEYFFHDEDDDFLYIVLEKCDMDLSKLLQQKNWRAGGKRDLDIMFQASCGLSYLHSKNIVHRDVKLSNFLVKFVDLSHVVIKLSDFGISKILDPDKTSTAASMNGTVGYKASEILNGLRLRKVSDVFALGIVFYKILTDVRSHPFGHNDLDIDVNIRDKFAPDLKKIEDLVAPILVVPMLWLRFPTVIEKMLWHDTAQRIPSKTVTRALKLLNS